MRKNAFVAMDHIAALNEFRKHSIQSGDLPLAEEDFRNALKACGIPSNSLFFAEFRNSGLLVRVEGDMWTWKNQLPIHHQTLQGIYVRYQKKREEVLKSKEIEEAVNLLKSNGFEVFAPYKGLYKKL